MNTNLQNINTNVNNNQTEETLMNTTTSLIQALTAHFNENPQGYSSYKKELELILKENIKPLTARSLKAGDDWRDEIKNRFGGRGSKWVFVDLQEIEPTLLNLESQGIDCTDYRKWTTKANRAWVRYTAARLHNGVKCAGFAVLNEGSTINKPKQLHFIDIEKMDNIIEQMPGTPKALKLEEDQAPMPNAKPKVEAKPVKKEKVVKAKENNLEDLAQEINLEMEIEQELNEGPDSNDPAEWEAFLAAEGLIDNDFDDEI